MKNPAAQALARKRWSKKSLDERKDIMAEVRKGKQNKAKIINRQELVRTHGRRKIKA